MHVPIAKRICPYASDEIPCRQENQSRKAYKKAVLLFDGGGLYLEVTPTGSKLWRLKYRLAGKDNRMSLDRYPDMSQRKRRTSGNCEVIFPSAMSNTRCISDVGLLNVLRRMGDGNDKMIKHGFRTSASTMLNEKGYKRDWIEAQLAHAEKKAIRDAYNRAEYLPESRKMMCESG